MQVLKSSDTSSPVDVLIGEDGKVVEALRPILITHNGA